jgi:hypothetical protein
MERRKQVDAQYEWLKFYEAAVLETNPTVLSERIEAAQNAIGQRVIAIAVDETERRAIIRTLNALAALKRERSPRGLCCHCLDAHDLVTAMNGKTYLAKTALGEIAVILHTRCILDWGKKNDFQALAPLRRARAAGQG